jgi:hypothetical protein
MMPRLIYEVLYRRLIYVGPERMLKVAKDIEIPISRAEVLEHHCKHCAVSKLTYMIFYTPLALATRSFIEICIDTIEYKLFSTNDYKYIVYILDRYSNY